ASGAMLGGSCQFTEATQISLNIIARPAHFLLLKHGPTHEVSHEGVISGAALLSVVTDVNHCVTCVVSSLGCLWLSFKCLRLNYITAVATVSHYKKCSHQNKFSSTLHVSQESEAVIQSG
ncbi:hypothetical protein OTU49_002611, partial [Cherax quadricarinatus]